MTRAEWVEPALLWDGRKLESLKRPRLLELRSDDFMPEFLGAMTAQNAGAAPQAYLKSRAMDAAKPSVKLYQPLHGCYYLVTASLVCRQIGLPDKSVERKNGETTSFVIRRNHTALDANGGSRTQEEGWVDDGPNKGWQPLTDARGKSVQLRADEERFPMHAISVCAGSAPATFDRVGCRERVVYHGYLATGNREKYLQTFTAANATPAAALSAYLGALSEATAALPAGALDKTFDFRADEFDSRVIAGWQALIAADVSKAVTGTVDAARLRESSLYLLLDLADALERLLPEVWKALKADDINQLGSRPASRTLFSVLSKTRLTGNAGLRLAQALRDLAPKIGLVRGEDIAEPATAYDLVAVDPRDQNDAAIPLAEFVGRGVTTLQAPLASRLTTLVKAALAEEPLPMTPTEELSSLLKDQVKLEPIDAATGKELTYFLRLVYDYDPDCPPVVSNPSQPFTFAKFFEPDAPARHIRIELPSIKMKDLRKYKKGVGLQMSPELRDVMNRVHKGMADGEALLPGGGSWQLGMICSFSIQIIFLVAFIVMFIFLIMLNIVFWWMAFLKICFPIPRRSG